MTEASLIAGFFLPKNHDLLGGFMRYLLLLFCYLFSFSIFANSFPDAPYVSVTGNASLEIEADQVIIQFQPNVINNSGEIAKQKLEQKLSLAFNNLKEAGFNTDHLETLSQSSRPEYDYQKNKRVLIGVRVTHQLSYRLTDIDKVNLFLDALLDAQIESISGLQYGLQDPHQWQEKVRKMAVLDSKQKAADLAQLYDAKLGKVYSISYANNSARPVVARAMAMESDAIKVKPKNITITDRVNTVFKLKP